MVARGGEKSAQCPLQNHWPKPSLNSHPKANKLPSVLLPNKENNMSVLKPSELLDNGRFEAGAGLAGPRART